MLARILFNLTFFTSIMMAFFAASKWGIAYAPPVALLTFFLGLMASFVIGMIQGASTVVYD
jgi:hypothetical protein